MNYGSMCKKISGYDIDFMYQDPPKEYHAGWFIKEILSRIINPNPKKEYHVGLCPVCGNTLEQIPDPLYQLPKKRRGDIYFTYDGFCVVSEKFKQFCDMKEYPNLTFVKLVNTYGYYYFMPNDIFEIDYIRSKTRFSNKRTCCGSWDGIWGLAKYKDANYVLTTNDFIRRGQLLRGSQGRKSPDIIVGLKTYEDMMNYGLMGICTFDIFE